MPPSRRVCGTCFLVVLLLLLLLLSFGGCRGWDSSLQGCRGSAKEQKWDGCHNASVAML